MQNRDHFGANITGQQGQHIGPAHTMAARFGFAQKRGIEGGGVNFAALEQGPSIGVGIGCINRADKVFRQVIGGFKARKGFKRAGRDHPAEIP